MARWYIFNVFNNEFEKVDLDIFIKHVEEWENNGFNIESVENDVCLFKYAYYGKIKILIAFSVAW